jgi:hypothetical protein
MTPGVIGFLIRKAKQTAEERRSKATGKGKAKPVTQNRLEESDEPVQNGAVNRDEESGRYPHDEVLLGFGNMVAVTHGCNDLSCHYSTVLQITKYDRSTLLVCEAHNFCSGKNGPSFL